MHINKSRPVRGERWRAHSALDVEIIAMSIHLQKFETNRRSIDETHFHIHIRYLIVDCFVFENCRIFFVIIGAIVSPFLVSKFKIREVNDGSRTYILYTYTNTHTHIYIIDVSCIHLNNEATKSSVARITH